MSATLKEEICDLISIIVPAYNCEDFLAECINSIRAQSSNNWEIVLVNDGSTDNTGKICDEFASIDERISVVHQSNFGQNGARLRGLLEANGEHVTFVDSDDVVSEKMIEVFQRTISLHAFVDLAIYGIVRSDEHLLNQCPIKQNKELNGCYQTMQFRRHVFSRILLNDSYSNFGLAPSLCGKLYSKDLARKCMSLIPKSIKMGEDGVFFHTTAWFSRETVVALDEEVYCYRVNKQSVSNRYIPNMSVHNELLHSYYSNLITDSDDRNLWKRINQYHLYMTDLALRQEARYTAFNQKSIKIFSDIVYSETLQNAIKNLPLPIQNRWFSFLAFLAKRKLTWALILAYRISTR